MDEPSIGSKEGPGREYHLLAGGGAGTVVNGDEGLSGLLGGAGLLGGHGDTILSALNTNGLEFESMA
jgi:hypothetical protein